MLDWAAIRGLQQGAFEWLPLHVCEWRVTNCPGLGLRLSCCVLRS